MSRDTDGPAKLQAEKQVQCSGGLDGDRKQGVLATWGGGGADTHTQAT